MKGIERRINRLDKQVAQFPCTEPGHGALTVFIVNEANGLPNAKDQALMDSMNNCERCKDKMFVFIMHFATPLKPVPIDVTPPSRHEPAPIKFTYNIGDGGNKPEQPAHVRIAQWLEELE